MKLEEMNLELAQNMMNWWAKTGETRVDELKNPDVLYHWLFTDSRKPPFYVTNGVIFILNNLVPGESSFINELGILEGDYDPKEIKKELIAIAREYELRRITFVCPSNVTEFSPALKALGFKYEGRMRFAAKYNGKLADLDIYGFYTIKPQKRRRRGRRNGRKETQNNVSNRTSNPTTEQDSVHGEQEGGGNAQGEILN